jgi:hypothetical protein
MGDLFQSLINPLALSSTRELGLFENMLFIFELCLSDGENKKIVTPKSMGNAV